MPDIRSANLTTRAAMSEGAVCSVLLGAASDPLQHQDRLLRRNSQVCAPFLLGSAQSLRYRIVLDAGT